eukprot:snap_masked-scaffold_31-processed-gene-3.27-mRNA-1 protein AED:1.00 eAED:1.00 QI:0/0/0/0/1/1/2/0/262
MKQKEIIIFKPDLLFGDLINEPYELLKTHTLELTFEASFNKTKAIKRERNLFNLLKHIARPRKVPLLLEKITIFKLELDDKKTVKFYKLLKIAIDQAPYFQMLEVDFMPIRARYYYLDNYVCFKETRLFDLKHSLHILSWFRFSKLKDINVQIGKIFHSVVAFQLLSESLDNPVCNINSIGFSGFYSTEAIIPFVLKFVKQAEKIQKVYLQISKVSFNMHLKELYFSSTGLRQILIPTARCGTQNLLKVQRVGLETISLTKH